METPGKSLQLILFTVEGKQSKTLLEDSLCYHPNYQVGDIIHLLHPPNQRVAPNDDHQYLVSSVKHIITTGGTGMESPGYILLVEVVELAAPERNELGTHPDHLTTPL